MYSNPRGKKLSKPMAKDLGLCHANTVSSVGWAICKHLLSGGCSLEKGCHAFDPELGTTNLIRHNRINFQTLGAVQIKHHRKLGRNAKEEVCRAACLATVEDLCPFSFGEGSGMHKFIKAVSEAGQATGVCETIDNDDFVPSAGALFDKLFEIAKATRKFYADGLASIVEYGGGMTVDDSTISNQDKHVYDLIFHYSDCEASGTTEMVCHAIVLTEAVNGHSVQGNQIPIGHSFVSIVWI